jgi:hypothetical protein
MVESGCCRAVLYQGLRHVRARTPIRAAASALEAIRRTPRTRSAPHQEHRNGPCCRWRCQRRSKIASGGRSKNASLAGFGASDGGAAPPSALFAHSSDRVLPKSNTLVLFAWIPGPQRVRDADDLTLAHRSEVPAVERVRMRLEEEKLTGEEGETPIPCRQGTVFGITLEGLGNSVAVDENHPVRPTDAVSAERNDPLEQDARAGVVEKGEKRRNRVFSLHFTLFHPFRP